MKDLDGALGRLWSALTGEQAKGFVVSVAVFAAAMLLLYLLARSRGIVATIVFVFLFILCFTLLPVAIGLFGSAVPNAVGKLHIVLGAVAFNHHYLVQKDNKWEWCPGDRGKFYLDGDWHDIEEDSLENYSVLGWRPFGVLRYKEDDTWDDKRVDMKARRNRGRGEVDPTTDGGQAVTETARGGWPEVDMPIISGTDGTWLLDLKRVYTRGIEKIGDVELIETAEEVIERGQVADGRMANWGPAIETAVGLILGIVAAYGYILIR